MHFNIDVLLFHWLFSKINIIAHVEPYCIIKNSCNIGAAVRVPSSNFEF